MAFLKNFTSAILPRPAYQLAKAAQGYFKGRATLLVCVDEVRQVFPAFSFSRARIVTSGFANHVVIFDEAWVFRFPRTEDRRKQFEREVQLLLELRPLTELDLPNYSHVAPGFAFGGYKMIRGEGLEPALLSSLDLPDLENVLTQFAQFLSVMHSLPVDLVASAGEARNAQSNVAAASWYFTEKRPYMAKKIDRDLVRSLDQFYHSLRELGPFKERFIHSDIGVDHLLYDQRSNTLGLIDFGNAAWGDPAEDFDILFSYPEWIAKFVFDRYEFAKADPGLLRRAKLHWIRDLGDRLWFSLLHDDPRSTAERISRLRDQLSQAY